MKRREREREGRREITEQGQNELIINMIYVHIMQHFIRVKGALEGYR